MRFLTKCFHRFSPETAHHLVVRLLRLAQWWHYAVLRRPYRPLANLVLRGTPTLRFPNRLGLAAGFDKNAEVFAELARMGFGFLEVGTVTPLPQPGNPKPRIWRLPEESLVNCLGFNNRGLDEFFKNVERYRKFLPTVPLLANVGKGKDTPLESAHADYARGISKMAPIVDGFVINISSPNTPGLFQLQNAEFLEKVAAAIPDGMPAFVKLSPDLEISEMKNLAELVNANSRFSGLVLTNTSPKMAKAAGKENGGLSGAPLFSRSLECVGAIRDVLKAPKVIIGVGGINTVERARQMRAAGADLIEVYTSFIYRGPGWIKELARALSERE